MPAERSHASSYASGVPRIGRFKDGRRQSTELFYCHYRTVRVRQDSEARRPVITPDVSLLLAPPAIDMATRTTRCLYSNKRLSQAICQGGLFGRFIRAQSVSSIADSPCDLASGRSFATSSISAQAAKLRPPRPIDMSSLLTKLQSQLSLRGFHLQQTPFGAHCTARLVWPRRPCFLRGKVDLRCALAPADAAKTGLAVTAFRAERSCRMRSLHFENNRETKKEPGTLCAGRKL